MPASAKCPADDLSPADAAFQRRRRRILEVKQEVDLADRRLIAAERSRFVAVVGTGAEVIGYGLRGGRKRDAVLPATPEVERLEVRP